MATDMLFSLTFTLLALRQLPLVLVPDEPTARAIAYTYCERLISMRFNLDAGKSSKPSEYSIAFEDDLFFAKYVNPSPNIDVLDGLSIQIAVSRLNGALISFDFRDRPDFKAAARAHYAAVNQALKNHFEPKKSPIKKPRPKGKSKI